MQLGDIIDGNDTDELTEKDMVDVMRVVAKCERPLYHVIGNHCLRLAGGKPAVMERLGVAKNGSFGGAFYKFDPVAPNVRKSGHTFLVLDGTDISINNEDPEDPRSRQAEEWMAKHPVEDFPNSVPWNGAISDEQMAWFEHELEVARKAQSKVFVFCHYPILADHLVMAISILWNAPQVIELLDKYEDVVVVWFAGHFHRGGAQVPSKEKNTTEMPLTAAGTPRKWAHITLEAILMAEDQSFAEVDVYERGVVLRGTGKCTSHSWHF